MRHRLFFALWPDPPTRAAIDAAARTVVIAGGTRVALENLHVTLLFLGAVDDTALPAVIGIGDAVRAAPFCLELTETGWWRQPRVVWLAPATVPAALEALAAELKHRAGSLGLALDERPFRPHLTIARKVARKPQAAAGLRIRWDLADFVLVRSVTTPAGARYEVLREWALTGAAGG